MTRPVTPIDGEAKLFLLTVVISTLLAVVIAAACIMNNQAAEIERLKQRINAQNHAQMNLDAQCVAWFFQTDLEKARKRMCSRGFK